MIRAWGARGHVQAIDIDFQRDRAGFRPQWLHQMRPDLGRLDAIAEILQVGSFVGIGPCRKGRHLGFAVCAVVCCDENAGEHSMKVFRSAAVIVFLAGPAWNRCGRSRTPRSLPIHGVACGARRRRRPRLRRSRGPKPAVRQIKTECLSRDECGVSPSAPAQLLGEMASPPHMARSCASISA